MRLSVILSEIYNEFLPKANAAKIQLDLDLGEHESEIEDAEIIRTEINRFLETAAHRSAGGTIKISAGPGKRIAIQDSGTTLSPTACALLSRGRVNAKSRVGFGTTVEIDLHKKLPEN